MARARIQCRHCGAQFTIQAFSPSVWCCPQCMKNAQEQLRLARAAMAFAQKAMQIKEGK